MAVWQRKIAETLVLERDGWLHWAPVFVALGVGSYFALAIEPNAGRGVQLLLLMAAALGIARWRQWRRAGWLLMPLALTATGFAAAQWRAQDVAAPALTRDIPITAITGTIERIEPREKDTRLFLTDLTLENVLPNETPRRISLALKGLPSTPLLAGHKISVRGGLFPPPLPAAPGAFDFRRHFYFKQIGAVSFAHVNSLQLLETRPADAWVSYRQVLNDRALEVFGKETGSIVAALLTGMQSAIPESAMESMRLSGLAHMLSISGMHLGLVASLVYFTLKVFFSLIPPLALRVQTKKIAAALALLASYAYLELADAPIPATRAFVMVALVMGAILLGRQVMPMRSLALAAIFLLIVSPEGLLSPSFQLSFAATAGIIAWYEARRGRWQQEEGLETPSWRLPGWLYKPSRMLGGIAITSIIATAATAPFVLHHFEHFPLYGVLANMLAVPMLSFWVMPALLLWLVTGWTWVAVLLDAGIRSILWVAQQVSTLPGAVYDLPPLTMPWLVLATLGMAWICLLRTRWRHAGWPIGALAIVIGLLTYVPPDVLVSQDGKKLAIRLEDGIAVMLKGGRSGFTQDQWKHVLNADELLTLRQFTKLHGDDDRLRCDAWGCMFHPERAEKPLAVEFEKMALAEDCPVAGLLILPNWSLKRDAVRECADVPYYGRYIIDWSEGLSIRAHHRAWQVRTVRESSGDRLWTMRPTR